ncbi:ATP-binding protein [Streptomyces sp. NBC_01476]|uniref:ATP-binding protein n=1 Tax=Streptomyces sp. NBC_01476 TaxID=2903881 RepID=UPI002E3696F5|nr:ATP-binding protein [Streptomyces sp. NBC_01476]
MLPRAVGGSVRVSRWARSPRCVTLARHELVAALDEWKLPELADTAELVLSELLTNALRHARVPRDRLMETRYERLSAAVRLEVHDADEAWPVVRHAAADSECGRGLALVGALTGGRWGVGEREGIGKLVWAVVGDAAEEPFTGVGEDGL